MFYRASGDENTTVYYGGKFARQLLKSASRTQAFLDLDFATELCEHVAQIMQGCQGHVLSFDVFDTILLRNQKCEMRRFMEMGELFASAATNEYGARYNGTSFFVARILATKHSYRNSPPVQGFREGTLEDIHRGIARLAGLPLEFAGRLREIELAYEIDNLEPNPIVTGLCNIAESMDIEVVLISDMYMAAEEIAHLLEAHLPGAFTHRRIYSSADFKINKRGGRIFDKVAADYGAEPSTMLHVGDNLWADYVCPKRRGWNALHIPHAESELLSIEEDEAQFCGELAGMGINLKGLVGN